MLNVIAVITTCVWIFCLFMDSMLCKIRHYVNETALRSIYYAIFQSHLSYVCTAWGQNIKYNH